MICYRGKPLRGSSPLAPKTARTFARQDGISPLGQARTRAKFSSQFKSAMGC